MEMCNIQTSNETIVHKTENSNDSVLNEILSELSIYQFFKTLFPI